jgi:type VI secretion system secreted protein VgrG
MSQDLITISSSALPGTTRVAAFTGVEAISRPYEIEIFLLIRAGVGEEIDLADPIGAKARLVIDRQNDRIPPFVFCGVFGEVELLHAIDGWALVRALLVPRLWQLGLSRHSRIFTLRTVPEVIEAVLQDNGLTGDDYELRLGAYEIEEHICQYRESDLDFISRWMEREGIFYYFEHGEDREKLILSDSISYDKSPINQPVRYYPQAGGDTSAGASLRSFKANHATLPAKVMLKDYDYARPKLDVSGTAPVSDSGVGEVSLYGERFFSPGAGSRLAMIRSEELLAKKVTYRAKGTRFHLRPGYTFDLEEHPLPSFNAGYLTTTARHYGNQAAQTLTQFRDMVDLPYDDIYVVELTAIRSSTQFRAESRTPWPRIYGFQNGIIEGPANSEYAQIDNQGRYSVKFQFDESDLRGTEASTFVRMIQPHGGSIEGFHFPLRKGTEVMISFLGGDPDRPVIAGVAPNALTPSPITSSNHTRNVIQTGGRNRLEIEDLAGQQRITLSTPHANTYLRMGSANDDHELIAKTDMRGLWRTGNNTDFDIKGHWWIEVNKDKKEHVTGAVEELFKVTKLEQVPNGSVTEEYKSQKTTIETTYDFKVGTTTTEMYTGNHTITHDANVTEKVKGNYHLGVGADPEGGAKHAVNVTGNYKMHVTSSETRNIDAGQTITVKGGQTTNVSKGDITFNVPANNFIVNCVDKQVTIKGKSWHETNGPKSELVWGMKHDTVLGLHSDNHIGLHQEFHAVGAIDVFVGLKLEIEAAAGIHLRVAEIADKRMHLGSFGVAIRTTAAKITNGAVKISQRFHIIS